MWSVEIDMDYEGGEQGVEGYREDYYMVDRAFYKAECKGPATGGVSASHIMSVESGEWIVRVFGR